MSKSINPLKDQSDVVISFKDPCMALLFAQIMQNDHGFIPDDNLRLECRLADDRDPFMSSAPVAIKLRRDSKLISWWNTCPYPNHIETPQQLRDLLYGKKMQMSIGEYTAEVLPTHIQVGCAKVTWDEFDKLTALAAEVKRA